MVVWVLSDDSWGDTGRWQVSTWPLPWPPPWCPALRGPGPFLPTGTHRHNAASRVSCPQDKDPPQSSQQEASSERPVSSGASLTGEETRPLKCQGPWGSGKGPSAWAFRSSPGAAGGLHPQHLPQTGLPACLLLRRKSSQGPQGTPSLDTGLWARREEGGL